MAVQKAVFQADFGDFDAAVSKAETGLKNLERSTTAVGTGMVRVTTAAKEGIGPAKDLGAAYQQFDNVLAAAGIHIGPQVKGLQDMAAAAGKTATEIGLLGTAGLAIGAAYTGWNIGRAIADFFELDDAIEQATAGLFGFKTAAQEGAAAQLDTIHRAIREGIGIVPTYTQAQRFLAEQQKDNVAKAIDWTARLREIHTEVLRVNPALENQIRIAKEAGATVEQITRKYGLSAEAQKLLADRTNEAAAAQKKANDERAREIELEDKKAAALAKTRAEQLAIFERDAATLQRQKEAIPDIKAMDDAYAKRKKTIEDMMGAWSRSSQAAKANKEIIAEQEKMLEADYQKTVVAAQAAGDAHTEAGAAAQSASAATVAGYAAQSQEIQHTAESVKALITLRQYQFSLMAASESYGGLSPTSGYYASLAAAGKGSLGIASFQSGVTNFGGGLARVHQDELLVNLPAGTSVIPKGGGGVTVQNTFHLVDTQDNLARRVSDTILRTVRAGTQLGTA